MPLVLASLVTGIASLADLNKLSRIGGKTIAIYLLTTFIALIIGLGVVNIFQPGTTIPDGLRTRLQNTYQTDIADRETDAQEATEAGPLEPLVEMVPENILGAATNNRAMLSVVFVAFLFGVSLMLLPREKAKPLLDLFESLDAVIIKIVEIVISCAALGVFCLIAGTITAVSGDDPSDVFQLLSALGLYCFTVSLGMTSHTAVSYTHLTLPTTP